MIGLAAGDKVIRLSAGNHLEGFDADKRPEARQRNVHALNPTRHCVKRLDSHGGDGSLCGSSNSVAKLNTG
jgi:hypothetical protein